MSLQTPTTIRSRPNKLYGKAKATPIGRRRGPAVKSVGKPDALIGHVRFDERGRETERIGQASSRRALPRLYWLALSSASVTPSRPCHVSSPRLVERSMRISRTALSCLLRLEAYAADPAGAAFGLVEPLGSH